MEGEKGAVKFDGGLAFMFESSLMLSPTKWAMGTLPDDDFGKGTLQTDYNQVWQGLSRHFQ